MCVKCSARIDSCHFGPNFLAYALDYFVLGEEVYFSLSWVDIYIHIARFYLQAQIHPWVTTFGQEGIVRLFDGPLDVGGLNRPVVDEEYELHSLDAKIRV